MEIKVKNPKSDKESAYKTGSNLSQGLGVNPNTANPGALTGKYGNGLKNNTMNLPLMGTNFQVTIKANNNRTFDNISGKDYVFISQNAAQLGGSANVQEIVPVEINTETKSISVGEEKTETTDGVLSIEDDVTRYSPKDNTMLELNVG